MKITYAGYILLGFVTTWPSAIKSQSSAEIFVNADQVQGSVNRLIFGHNIEAADNANIFSSDTTDLNLIQRAEGAWDPLQLAPVPEIVDQSRSVKMSVLRYPGGCLAHNFDWRKTVGPEAKRNGWLFGVDEYMSLCQAVGAVPLITISDYALPIDQMPQNASQLVEYLNSSADTSHPWAMKRKNWGHAAPYNVTWFELGNESMHGNHRVLPHRQYSAEQYATYANATAAAMRKVDSHVKLGIVMMPGPGTDVECDWNRTVIRLAGKSADFVVVHMYTPAEPKTDISGELRLQAMMAAGDQVAEHIKDYHQMIRRELGHDLPLAITEFNGAIDQPAYRFSLGDAIECADLLRVFLKPESNVAMANYFNFLNGAFGMLHTNLQSSAGDPLVEEPALLLYKLWAQHFGTQLISVEVKSPRAEFTGAGSINAAYGTSPGFRKEIQHLDLAQYSSAVSGQWAKLPRVTIHRDKSNFIIHLQGLASNLYPLLAQLSRPELESPTPVEFEMSFDARFTPDKGSDVAPMGIGLMDSRGWTQTHSGIGVDDISNDWKHLEGTYRLAPETPGVNLIARLLADGKNVSGTLEVRNLEVTDAIPPHAPAYDLLTASASLSTDGKTIYLILFNKSASEAIQGTIHIAGLPVAQAHYWEVSGPSLASTTGVSMTALGTPLLISDTTTGTHSFPPRSMTAIEFNLVR